MTAPEESDLPGLDGHTIEQLSDYLDRDRTPPDLSIEHSPGCQIALTALMRLRTLSQTILESEAAAEPVRDERWIDSILNRISLESHAGRKIPYAVSTLSRQLAITEGAVRGIVRSAGDSVGDAIIGRCRLSGDVTALGEPITVSVEISVFWGRALSETIARVREAILRDLAKHSQLNVVAIDVTVQDLLLPRSNDRSATSPSAEDPR